MSMLSLLGAPPGQMKARLIFALDVASVQEALAFVDQLRDEVGMFKVGKQLFLHAGPEIIRQIRARDADVFLDLKFHDIPHTATKASAEATRLGVRLLDLHASGSVAMMKQTIAEVNKVSRTEHLVRPKLLAVTVLTSLNQDDMKHIGVRSGVESQVVRLARLARDAGMDGVVASPHEVGRIRKECGRRFLIVTPGIRPPKGALDDQKRVMTPEAAIRAGANYLVVGSPIRDAADPVAAARAIVESMERGAGLGATLRA
jgi:orotidine-5'-phosphate decarboxylase